MKELRKSKVGEEESEGMFWQGNESEGNTRKGGEGSEGELWRGSKDRGHEKKREKK